jgi:cell division protein FtsB
MYSLLHLAGTWRAVAEMEHTAAEAEQELEALQQEQAALLRRLGQRESPAEMEALARRELGMVMPGEIVFSFRESGETERDPTWRWK